MPEKFQCTRNFAILYDSIDADVAAVVYDVVAEVSMADVAVSLLLILVYSVAFATIIAAFPAVAAVVAVLSNMRCYVVLLCGAAAAIVSALHPLLLCLILLYLLL